GTAEWQFAEYFWRNLGGFKSPDVLLSRQVILSRARERLRIQTVAREVEASHSGWASRYHFRRIS
ncbi:MAG: hypothetical protein Q7T55_16895, partial [Solirubrobacteraceae bacterium]|nr:hypothetical protein [Solirubrobacteraceae bacterium]